MGKPSPRLVLWREKKRETKPVDRHPSETRRFERRGHRPDDRERFSGENDGATNRRRVAPEALTPHSVRQDGDASVVDSEVAAERGTNAEHMKERVRNLRGADS